MLDGTITALITPFTRDGSSVDFAGLTELIGRQIDAKVSGLLPLGTTGETPTLTAEEKEAIITHTIKVTDGRVPVMVGCGTNNTKTTITATQRAKELGADSALIVSPYYNRPSQEGLYAHFSAVCEATDLPIVVYNIAGRTGVNIETPTLQRIAKHTNIIGVKEASGNLKQIADVIRTIQNEQPGFTVVSGDDGLTVPLIALGGRGVISVASNLIPAHIVELVSSALHHADRARELHHRLTPLIDALFIESNPAPLKTALELCGFRAGPVRLPLVELQPTSLAALKAALQSLDLLN
jgi:4-hydroxy-tetrahydrodipicolinate synthase